MDTVRMKKIEEYARLLVEIGLNVQQNQTLVISCPVDAAWFARMCAKAAYDVKCREVVVDWSDDILSREKYLRANDEIFDCFPTWRKDCLESYAKQGAARLAIYATDPENLKGVDTDRLLRMSRVSGQALQEYSRLQMANAFPWCVASIPIASWAKKVFPGAEEEQAMEQLWDAILDSVRITGDGKAVERWKAHDQLLHERMQKLNEMRLCSLHYTNALGTDLTIRLPEDHLWSGGSCEAGTGQTFIANMPTEELFTAPLKTGINGVVYASRPLVCGGNLVKNFHFVIRDGKIVEAHAEQGEEFLKTEISVDEGASYFGEVALVPYDSPISNQKLLYFNTLFDENASCHLAFGDAYPECLKGGNEMSPEQLQAHGLNHSDVHEDFMIGTPDLRIVGTDREGREIPIFENGNFCSLERKD